MEITPNIIRIKILEIAEKYHHGHIASALSIADILYILFYKVMDEDDKFILSKGHACLGLYAVLSLKRCTPNMSYGHPEKDIKNKIECTTGSLGHGLPIAVGMAFSKKLKKESGNIYVIVGDGECQEGTTWESLLFASYHKLDNLIVFVDNNNLQAIDFISNVLSLNNLSEKFKSFGASVVEIDGHNLSDIQQSIHHVDSKPHFIIAHTIKGKGLMIAENKPGWHYRELPKDMVDDAIRRLNEKNIR